MAISTKHLCNYWHTALLSTNRGLLHALIMESISPQERQVYCMVEQQPGIDGAAVAQSMGIALNHADGILKRLHDWKLLKRERREDKSYTWEVIPPTGRSMAKIENQSP